MKMRRELDIAPPVRGARVETPLPSRFAAAGSGLLAIWGLHPAAVTITVSRVVAAAHAPLLYRPTLHGPND